MMRYSVAVLAVAAVLAAPAGARTTATTLEATVGPGFTISLRDASGAGVSQLDSGTYTFHVNDQSDFHNFHLSGPGVDKSTDVPGTGEQTWDVTLTDGKYTYICDAHATTMKGSFTVGTVAVPPPVVTQKLFGSVGPGAKIAFVRSAKSGKAVLTIRDRSATDNFHLTGPGVNRKTAVRSKATVKWTVTLKAGAYTYRSDAHAKLKGTMRVS